MEREKIEVLNLLRSHLDQRCVFCSDLVADFREADKSRDWPKVEDICRKTLDHLGIGLPEG